MKKVSAAAGAVLICLAGSAWAAGPSSPGDMGMGSYDSSSMPSSFAMPVNPNTLANTYAGGGMGMMGGSYPSSGSSDMPVVDLRRVVWQGVQGLPEQQRYTGAAAMANQNLQGLGSGTSSIAQLRNNIRNQIMGSRINEISRMGQSTFRPMIQPGAVQSMISQIQPWNFPIRFQSAMMPMMVPFVSQPIKPQQMAYMQQGIMNNPNFPNVPLPAPIYSPYPYPYPNTGGGYPSPPGGMGMGSGYGTGMPPGGMGMGSGYGMGMPPGGMGMGYGAAGYGMSAGGMMMPGMGMGMGMMPNMGMMGGGYSPYGY